MSLPPVEKIPLAPRKDLRDEFDNKKAELEQDLSKALGETWTIEHNPLALYAYASEDFSKQRPGSWAYEYYDCAARRISERDDFTKKAINQTASSHIMTLEAKPDATFSYSSSEFRDGKLVLVFNPKDVSSNINNAATEEQILPALNRDDQSSPISFMARRNIAEEYEKEIGEIKAKIEKILGKPVTLTPNFEENFAKVKPVQEGKEKRWDYNFGYISLQYFSGLASQLDWQKFEGDDMLQEGFFDVIDSAEVVIQVVEKLSDAKRSYNEIVLEGGKLYLQTVPNYWGTNVDNAADQLVNKL